MSLIINYSNPLPLPTHFPVPKAWMHYGNRFTMVLGGLIDHAQGKHLFLHPQPFWPKDANLVISTLFHHICTCILSCTVPHSRPSTLYLQADNCAGENKNIYMLMFLSLLISLDMFQEIYLSFLLVGHTHEDINQLFSMVQMKFHTSTIHTPGYTLPLAICTSSDAQRFNFAPGLWVAVCANPDEVMEDFWIVKIIMVQHNRLNVHWWNFTNGCWADHGTQGCVPIGSVLACGFSFHPNSGVPATTLKEIFEHL